MGLLSKLFDPGKKDRRRANAAAQQAQVKGGGLTGPLGIGASFNFDRQGRASQSFGLGEFDPIVRQLLQQSAGSMGNTGQLSPELQQLFGGAIGDVSTPSLQYSDLSLPYGGLAATFGANLGLATANPFALGQGVSDTLNQLAERDNRQLVNQKFQTLQQSGRLGSSAGIAEAYREQEALDRAGLQRDLAGLQAGQSIQQNALGALFQSAGGMQNIASQLFGEQLSGKELLAQFANQRFGMGQQQQLLQNALQAQNFQQGLQGIQTAGNVSQIPLAFQQALLSAQGLKSNADLGIAGNYQQSAANAKSPLLELANTVGQFFSPIKFPGTP